MKVFKSVMYFFVLLFSAFTVSAQEAMREFLPAGEYNVESTVKLTGKVFPGNNLVISGNSESNWIGSTYQTFAKSVCSRNVVLVQKIEDSKLYLTLTRPTMKDCQTTEWIVKKTLTGFVAESYDVLDGVRSEEVRTIQVITRKK